MTIREVTDAIQIGICNNLISQIYRAAKVLFQKFNVL